MKGELENCPNCQTPGVSPWAFFASWPFSVRCKNCGARLRAKIPHWQNILAQILGQGAFWTVFLFGITAGSGGIVVGALIGAVMGALIIMVPCFFAKLEVLP
jgi:hypothetical protein